jgi:hypothetical protein
LVTSQSPFNNDVLSFDVPLLPKTSAEVILRGLRHWHEHQYANSRYVRCWLLRLNRERRKREAERESENDSEPDPPHGHLGTDGWREV